MNNTILKKNLAWITCALLLCTVPFLFQELHNDDFFWILTAQEVGVHPLTPLSGAFTIGENTIDLFSKVTHPPVYFYFLSVIMLLSGGLNLVILHLSNILFPALAAFSMYFLSRRFTTYSLSSTLLFIGSPAIMVMSHNFHCDIPNLSFLLASIATYIYGSDNHSRGWFYVSGIVALLAILTAYQSLLILGLLPAYTLLQKNKTTSPLPALIIPVIGFLAWSVHNISLHGIPHILALVQAESGESLTVSKLGLHTMMMMSMLGGAIIIPPFLVFSWIDSRLRLFLLLGCIAVGASFIFGNPLNGFTTKPLGSYSSFHTLLFVSFFSTGLFIFSATILNALTTINQKQYDPDTLFLLYWFLLFFTAIPLFLPFVSVRYLLPLLPCTILIACRSIKRNRWIEKTLSQKSYLSVLVLFSTITGFTVSAADYEVAGLYRKIPDRINENKTLSRTWITGISAFFYHMTIAGYTALQENDTRPKPGDVVLQSKNLSAADSFTASIRNRLKIEKKIPLEALLPIRTMDYASHTGFYTYVWGFLPYSFSSEPLDEIIVYRVQ